MRYLCFIFIIISGISTHTYSDMIREELPSGTAFTTRIGFWVYEIKGRLPYGKETHYVMSSSRGRGIGESKYRYIGTLPAGTQLEVVNLIKKNKRNWFYIVKIRDFGEMHSGLARKTPSLGEALIVISSFSMLKVPEGKMWLSNEPLDIRRTKLDPDLFTDFHYPDISHEKNNN